MIFFQILFEAMDGRDSPPGTDIWYEEAGQLRHHRVRSVRYENSTEACVAETDLWLSCGSSSADSDMTLKVR